MTIETRSSLICRLGDPADADAWSEFNDLYRPLLLHFVQRRGFSYADACDMVQDVFARLFQALLDFRLDHSRGRFRSWLWRVALNAVADWGRRQKHQDRAREAWLERPPKEDEEPDAEWTIAYRQRVMEFVLEQVGVVRRPLRQVQPRRASGPDRRRNGEFPGHSRWLLGQCRPHLPRRVPRSFRSRRSPQWFRLSGRVRCRQGLKKADIRPIRVLPGGP